MSSIGGFSPLHLPDVSEPVPEAPAGDAPAATTDSAATVARTGAGMTPQIASQLVNAHIDLHDLAAKLEAQGETHKQARTDAAKLMKTATDIDVLEKQLDEKKALEKSLEDFINDPKTDPLDAAWSEFDLWDVRGDIYEIEAKLGKLEGKLDDLMSKTWSALGNVISLTGALQNVQSQKADEHDLRTKDDLRHAIEQAERNLRNDHLASLREQGILPPTPPAGEATKKALEKVRKQFDGKVKDAAKLKEFKAAVRSARGA